MEESKIYEKGIQAVFEKHYDIASNSSVTNLNEMHEVAEILGFFERRYQICLEIESKQRYEESVDNVVNAVADFGKAVSNLVGEEDWLGALHD